MSADRDAVLLGCSTQSGGSDADVLRYLSDGALLDDVLFVQPVKVVRIELVIVANWDAVLSGQVGDGLPQLF